MMVGEQIDIRIKAYMAKHPGMKYQTPLGALYCRARLEQAFNAGRIVERVVAHDIAP